MMEKKTLSGFFFILEIRKNLKIVYNIHKGHFLFSFQNLGNVINNDEKFVMDIHANRVRKTKNLFYAISKTTIFGKRNRQSVKLKDKIASPTYPMEIWAIKESQQKITAVETTFLRKISGKTKLNRETNENIKKKVESLFCIS